ncbi:MAG: PIG-L family deacetylase [Methanobacteriaceae archaeon]|nr:PIG-L family deacetylase [Methanobacteriaceae archaeon]
MDSEKLFQIKITRKGIIYILIFIVLLISAIYLIFLYYEDEAIYSKFQPAPDVKSSDRILIFAPHPDDESLGTGGIIARAIEKNATVKVVMVTDGSKSHTHTVFKQFQTKTNLTENVSLPELRHNETLTAIKNLGLNESNIIFLGYPDGGLRKMLNDHWDYGNPYKSDTDYNQYDHVPYSFAYEKNAPYTGASVVKNMESIIQEFKPNIIFYPDDGDDHPDHWAVSFFAQYAIMETNYTGSEYTYLVHKGFHWPKPEYYLPHEWLIPPRELFDLDANWTYFSITENEENKKRDAVNSHKSQIHLTRDYLQSFVRVNDLLAIYPYITVAKDNGNLSKGIMPSSSYKDERVDYKTRIFSSVEDLTSAGISYDDQYVYLVVETGTDIPDDVIHNLHLRWFNGQTVKRIDIKVKDGVAQYESKANNSIVPSDPPLVEEKENMILVKLPKSIFTGTQEALMSIDVATKDNDAIDIMAWRGFDFPASAF